MTIELLVDFDHIDTSDVRTTILLCHTYIIDSLAHAWVCESMKREVETEIKRGKLLNMYPLHLKKR